jgi:hypothetical protein
MLQTSSALTDDGAEDVHWLGCLLDQLRSHSKSGFLPVSMSRNQYRLSFDSLRQILIRMTKSFLVGLPRFCGQVSALMTEREMVSPFVVEG